MADLGTAYVNIVPKAPGIEGKIEGILNEGSGGAESAGQSLGKKILGGMAKLGIGAAVVNTIKQSFEAGGALQQSFGGLDTLYGDAAAGMKEYAAQAASAGISMNNYAEQAVSFGAALKQAYGGDTLAAAEAANTAILDMADNAAKMGTPLESIQNAYQGFAKQNYTMLDNLKLGYGGTKEEMERLLADAQKFSGVEYDINNLGDVYSAIHVVQQELGIAGVAAEEASTTFTGSFGALKASWENVLAALTTGENMDTAMESLSNSVNAFATNIMTMLQNLAPQLPGLILGLADTIIDNAPELIVAGIELIAQLAVGLVQAIPDIINKIPEIYSKVGAAFGSVNWGQLGIDCIKGIAKGVMNAADSLRQALIDVAKQALQKAKDFLHIGSPSKLFADEVGKWIPAGVALGIETNMSPVDRAMRGLVSDSLMAAQSAYAPVAAAPAGGNITLYIDGIKYNTDDYIDSSITGFVENMVRRGNMYGR